MYLDLVERWIWRATGRTLDQHAADPIQAAAALPAWADRLRHARSQLLEAVDELRTRLINGDDLTQHAKAITGSLAEITGQTRDYERARAWTDNLMRDPDRIAYADSNAVQPVHRRYVNPGDTVLIVLPHLSFNREQQLAGRTVRVRITESDVELDPAEYPSPVRLAHGIAGVYRDPESRLYVLRATGQRRISR